MMSQFEDTALLYQSLDKEAYFARLVLQFRGDLPVNQKHHEHVREMNRFLCNSQYDEEEKKVGAAEKLQFNIIAPLINGVCGSAINNQRDVSYRPNAAMPSDEAADASEIIQKTASWIRRLSRAQVAEQRAFRDAVTSGIGYVETSIDYEAHESGEFIIESLPPEQIIYDANACRLNLSDAQHLFKVTRVPLWVLEQQFPDVPLEELSADWAREVYNDTGNNDVMGSWLNNGVNAKARAELPLQLLNLGDNSLKFARTGEAAFGYSVCAFWKENLIFYVSNINGRRMLEDDYIFFSTLPKEDFPQGTQWGNWEDWRPQNVKKKHKRVTLKAFLGGRGILGNITAPLCREGDFPILPITCYRDDYGKRYYGVAESTTDAQKLYNKLASQALYSLDNTATGGYFIGRNAFTSQQSIADFNTTVTDPGAVTLVDDITQIIPKTSSPPPETLFTLREQAEADIYNVTGISKEYLGQADRDQPNVLEVTRRQSTLNILADPFNALHVYMESVGRVLLWWVQHCIPDGTIINVSSIHKFQFTRQDWLKANFDIVIDDQPAGIDEKNANWQVIKDVMAQCAPLVQAGQMALTRAIVNASPLPPSVGDKLLSALERDIAQQKEQQQMQQKSLAQQNAASLASQQGNIPQQQGGNAGGEQPNTTANNGGAG